MGSSVFSLFSGVHQPKIILEGLLSLKSLPGVLISTEKLFIEYFIYASNMHNGVHISNTVK